MERLTKSLAFKARNIESDGTFEGYAAVFGNVDAWNDVITPGAFAKTLEEHRAKGTMPALLWQHSAGEPLGIWESLTEDDNGLAVKGRLLVADVRRAAEAHALLKAGAISGLSIGYYAREYSVDEKTTVRTLRDIELLEASLVTFPANDEARVSVVKAAPPRTIREFEAALRDVMGFSAKAAKRVASHGFRAREAPGFDQEAAAILESITQKY